MNLDGARTLVTGATGGLGEAIARACADRGSRVVVSGRRAEQLEAIATELGAMPVVADLANASDVAKLVETVGDLDILVSNAALPGGGTVESFSVEEIDRLLAVNLRAAIVLSRCFAEGMRQRARGHLVFVSSLAAAFPTPGLTLYNATKAALTSYALSLRGELASSGVGVSIINPGPISDAGMWADTGLAPPIGLRMRAPNDVALAVVRVIQTNKAKVDVAPLALRVGAVIVSAMPSTFVRVAPRLGAHKVTDAMAEALRHKR